MKEFVWEILSIDRAAGHMVVKYTYEQSEWTYNVPMPPINEDVSMWVRQYAPIMEWERLNAQFAQVEVGQTGAGTFGQPDNIASPAQDIPNLTGSWSEEYLRALIYQVFEEINESQV